MAVSVISCSKEKSTESGQGGPVTGSLKMKIDGQQWVANKSAGATILAGYIVITGLSNDNRNFLIQLEDNGIATYQLDQQSLGAAALTDANDPSGITYSTNQGTGASDAGGTVIVTKIDQVNKTISGTFSFKMFREDDNKQVTITEGSFENLKYTTELPPNNGADADFKVKINGTLWTAQVVNGAVSDNKLLISAASTDLTKTVILTMPANVTAGTYDFSPIGSYVGFHSSGPVSAPLVYASLSGKLIITEHNTSTKTIKGTFNFIGTDGGTGTVQLTEGSFTVKYL
jgi:hypothetical protein